MKTQNIISIESVIYFFMMCVFITSESTGESIESYHIVKGTPYTYICDNEYKFRNTPDDLPFIVKFPMNELKNDPEIEKIERGASVGRVVFEVYIKTEEKTEMVWLQYWIHTSVSDAEEALIERFNSPLGRFNAIDIGLEGEIGDNCWYSDYFIDFVRNNVQVCVCTDWTPPLPELIKKVSKKVDALLMETEKINDASLIPAPVIETVENLPDEVKHEGSLQLKVNAFDPNNQNLKYWLSFHHKISYDGILKMTFGETGSKTFKIWVMNENFIVSSKEVTF